MRRVGDRCAYSIPVTFIAPAGGTEACAKSAPRVIARLLDDLEERLCVEQVGDSESLDPG
jgi:hypothetical protein